MGGTLKRLILVAALTTALAAPGTALGGGLPMMTGPDAKDYARSAMRSKFPYFSQYRNRVGCGDRISRVRVRCKVKFAVGDTSAKGHVTVWYHHKRGGIWWDSLGKVKVLDTYCHYVLHKPKSQCTNVKKWR